MKEIRVLVKNPILSKHDKDGIKSIEIQQYDPFFVKWKTIAIGSTYGSKKAVANSVKSEYPGITVLSVDGEGKIVGYL